MTKNAELLNTSPTEESADRMEGESAPAAPRRILMNDWAVAAAYLVAALGVTSKLWYHLNDVMLAKNRADNVQFEWVLQNAAHSVRHLSNPFFTDLMGAPFGVNLMANTAIWGLALPLAPVTMLFGAPVSFRVLTTGVFVVTAFAWYYLLSRHVVRSRFAAFVGGGFCAFAPGMLAQGTGHPNIVAQFVLPLIIAVVLRLCEPGNVIRNGLVLAALVVYQIFINEEVLLLAATAIGVFVIVYGLQRPEVISRNLRGAVTSLSITAVTAGLVLIYPLYQQFFGPQSYHGMSDFILAYNTDLASYVGYAEQSLAGTAVGAQPLAQDVNEQNTFYGWALVIFLVVATRWMWSRPAVRALAATGGLFALFSLGRTLRIGGDQTKIPGAWDLFARMPLLDNVVPTRLSLVVIPVVGLLLAFFVEKVMVTRASADQIGAGLQTAFRWAPRVLGIAALVVVLLPIAPRPLKVHGRVPTPQFLTSSAWRAHVPVGSTVAFLPFGWDSNLNGMQWQTELGLPFKIANGYFLAPNPTREDRQAMFGVGPSLAGQVLGAGQEAAQPVSTELAAQCRDQLRSWNVSVLVLPDSVPNASAVRATTKLVPGAGQHVGDVWVWHLPGR